MSRSKRLFSLRVGLLLVVSLASCENDTEPGSTPATKPAVVTPLPDESHLADVELSQKAFDRLGITTARAQQRDATQVRRLGGEVMIPPGESATLVAPVSGTLQAPEQNELPKPGSRVTRGQVVFRFEPLLTPERFVPTPAERAQIANAQASLISLQMAADGDVQQFQEQVTAAQIALNRARQLRRDRVGSDRAVDDATAQLALAEAGLRVAEERKTILNRLTSDISKGTVAPLAFESPLDGIVRNVPVTVGQTVAAGERLFEVVNLDQVWIRVPVYVGQLDEFRRDQPVAVTFFGADGPPSKDFAMPVEAPPAADPLSATADLYYRIGNTSGKFRPGHRVSVALPLNTTSRSLTIPVNAVLYDIHGNTWVYAKTGDRIFRRSRVVVQRTTDEHAILAAGLEENSEVVVNGAAELFGTEFGTGK